MLLGFAQCRVGSTGKKCGSLMQFFQVTTMGILRFAFKGASRGTDMVFQLADLRVAYNAAITIHLLSRDIREEAFADRFGR